MTEDPIQNQRIATFVIDFDKHDNLEDAYKEKRRPFFLPLDRIEKAKKIPWDRGAYLLSKSMVNYPKYFEEGKW